MREMRVVGLGDGDTVVVETVPHRSGERSERFTLPIDEHLHAAVRGDLPRLGQIEIEQESQMRPREIQARVRAGESVEALAALAGVPFERIDRFAYPVLLERSRTAELARQAHPVRSDGPDVRTLDDVVADTFSRRGHDLSTLAWDSWRGEDGRWVVQLRWNAGRSDNRAHWTFHPGAHGGTVTAVDNHAIALIDPDAGTPLRTVPATTAGSAATEVEAEQPEQIPLETEEPAQDRSAGEAEEQAPPAALAVPDDGITHRPTERTGQADPQQSTRTGQDKPARSKRGRKNHPIVPSWEDVLLGTRSPRE